MYDNEKCKCKVCGKEFIRTVKHLKNFCSNECLYKYRSELYFKKYGVYNPMQRPEIKAKTRKTQIERYGAFAFNTPESKLKSDINSHTDEANLKRHKTYFNTLKNMNNEEILKARGPVISMKTKKVHDELLKKFNLDFKFESVLGDFIFDLSYKDLFIDINPSESHASNVSYAEITKKNKNYTCTTKDNHFKRQIAAESLGKTLVQVFDFTENYLDIIEFYLNKLGYIKTEHKNVSEIRFDHPIKHFWKLKYFSTPLEVYDAGIYYDIEKHEEKVNDIEYLNKTDDSFDVETESDTFDLSGVHSHNCRTRVIGNTYDKDHEQVTGRGNFSFNTLNLPRLGILAKGDLKKFFNDFDNLIDDAIQQLKDRFEYIGKKHVYNYPFLMGQGLYLDSDKYGPNDTIREILKQSSISVGFCGLAECLVALTGKHHGESEEAQELGLKIIQHLRDRMDEESKKTGLSWSCFATPAESTAGTFLRKDRKIFGVIPGVTDRDYYTNSFHVPVYYNTSILHKIDVESPYHEICNAGSITYIELDGDPNKNLDAYEAIVRYAAKKNLQYFSINTQNDQCPVCGYLGIIGDECPHCGFREGAGVSIEHLKEIGLYDEVLRYNQ
jgi:hypothetical protein